MTQLISLRAAARIIGIDASTAYRWARAGEIPHIRTRGRQMRVPRAALDAWLAEQADEALAATRRRAA